jgi:hypothetical protein
VGYDKLVEPVGDDRQGRKKILAIFFFPIFSSFSECAPVLSGSGSMYTAPGAGSISSDSLDYAR